MALRSNLLPIVLSVKRDSGRWRMNDPNMESSDEAFKMERLNVLARHRFACKFCGFESRKYQDVHHRDDNHDNNIPSNLLPACPYCHACHHVGFSGLDGTTELIHFSARSQVWINHLCRLYFVSKLQAENEYSRRIEQVYKAVLEEGRANMRAAYGKQMMGVDSGNPSWLASFLMSLDDETYSNRMNWGAAFNSLRLVRVKDTDSDRLNFWKSVMPVVDDWGLLANIDSISSPL